jgi:hypothetical protein
VIRAVQQLALPYFISDYFLLLLYLAGIPLPLLGSTLNTQLCEGSNGMMGKEHDILQEELSRHEWKVMSTTRCNETYERNRVNYFHTWREGWAGDDKSNSRCVSML